MNKDKLNNTIKVIDLFAGPGGLGEGFLSFQDPDTGDYPFEGLVSVEKDSYAHSTLRLRAFYRLLKKNDKQLPNEYYSYVNGKSKVPYSQDTKNLWLKAVNETLLLELGKSPEADREIFNKIKNDLDQSASDSPIILIGGPPCQAYSLVGRARNKGNKDYIPEEDHRHFLYREYLAIMKLFSPDFFVMENVKGLLSSKVNGGAVFEQIIQDLENCADGYDLFSFKTGDKYIQNLTNPKDFILFSEEYGIPQNRHRVIIFGIKKGSRYSFDAIKAIDKLPKMTVGEAIGDLPALRSPISNRGKRFKKDSIENWKENLVSGVNELIQDESLDSDFIQKLLLNLQKASSSELGYKSNAKYKKVIEGSRYAKFVNDAEREKITDHEARPHMDSDLLRYFFCSTYRDAYGTNARAADFPRGLAPEHKNWNSGKFVDRFKVQHFGSSSSTVTSHISKDGHYFIHSSPYQCRSLTVREAARLQSFPDSYQFMGKRTNKYHQVGNAVPPLLARQIAERIYSLITN